MNGNASKNYDYCIVVKKGDIESLVNFIKNEYTYIEYTLFTSNGVKYESVTLDEIMSYNNYIASKIVQIYIAAQNNKPATKIFYPDFAISLCDIGKYSTSVSYSIKNATEQEISHRSQKIEELIGGMKSKYSWLFKLNTIISVTFILYFVVVIPLQIFLKDKVNEVVYYLFPYSIGATVSWIVAASYEKIVTYFFPRTIFCIGKQEEFHTKKKKLRQNLLWGIVIAFFVSFITSILVFFLTK